MAPAFTRFILARYLNRWLNFFVVRQRLPNYAWMLLLKVTTGGRARAGHGTSGSVCGAFQLKV